MYGANPRFVYVTTEHETVTLFQDPMDGERMELATFQVPEDESSPIRLPDIDITSDGTILVNHWDGAWIFR